MESKSKLSLLLGGSLLFIICQVLTFLLVFKEKEFLAVRQTAPPQIPFGLALVYFVGITVLLSIILFLIPVSKLKIALKISFACLFSLAIFIIFGILLPFPLTLIFCFAAGLIWILAPIIWLHNLLMISALVSIGLIFGPCFSPWTVILLILAISIYDILAVRVGFMQWLVEKLAECEVLPGLVIPTEKITDWNLSLKKTSLDQIFKKRSTERGFSILGGGDIGFPLLLIVSVFSGYGFTNSLIVAVFSLIGLIVAYCIFLFFLKGKAMPALSSIVFFSVSGFLISLAL